MDYQQLGSSGPRVSVIGLGTMGMSDMYGPSDRAESVATIHAALDEGITLLDTGDFYGMGHNEMLVGEALEGLARERFQLSVKFGALRGPNPGEFNGYDSRPAAVRNFVAYSLKRLGVDHIDLYRPARLDPNVPIEDTIGAIAELIKQGHVRYIGLSEVGAATIRRAPRFQGANLDTNLALVEQLRAVAAAIGASVAQVAIAWVIARAAAEKVSVVALVGARRRDRLRESLGALTLELSREQMSEIERAVPSDAAAGRRYPDAQLAHMDSER